MKVRGWLIIGGYGGVGSSLPQERFKGYWPSPPDAAEHTPGDWISMTLNGLPTNAVCVEVSIA